MDTGIYLVVNELRKQSYQYIFSSTILDSVGCLLSFGAGHLHRIHGYIQHHLCAKLRAECYVVNITYSRLHLLLS